MQPLALVCMARLCTTTDSRIPALCGATVSPLSQHKSADLTPVSIQCHLNTREGKKTKKKTWCICIPSTLTPEDVIYYFSSNLELFVRKNLQLLLFQELFMCFFFCFFFCFALSSSRTMCPHILCLCPLIFSSPPTFNTFQSRRQHDSAPVLLNYF